MTTQASRDDVVLMCGFILGRTRDIPPQLQQVIDRQLSPDMSKKPEILNMSKECDQKSEETLHDQPASDAAAGDAAMIPAVDTISPPVTQPQETRPEVQAEPEKQPRKPRRPLTDEQKEALRQRCADMRAKRKANAPYKEDIVSNKATAWNEPLSVFTKIAPPQNNFLDDLDWPAIKSLLEVRQISRTTIAIMYKTNENEVDRFILRMRQKERDEAAQAKEQPVDQSLVITVDKAAHLPAQQREPELTAEDWQDIQKQLKAGRSILLLANDYDVGIEEMREFINKNTTHSAGAAPGEG